MIGAACLLEFAPLRQPFAGFHSSKETMAIEFSPRIVSTTVLGLR